jgi:F-type H+-transporting ATPase subunit delta
MNESKISVRYSKALFELAVEKKLLDKVYQDMIFIAELCKIEEVKEILESPVIVPSKKKAIMAEIFEKNIEKITMLLIDLLIKNGRETHLPDIARVFRDETFKYRGITATDLITATPVNEETRKKVIDLVSRTFNTKVELTETIDEKIIGGFILKVNDNYLDASVRNKLRKIKKGLTIRMNSTEE